MSWVEFHHPASGQTEFWLRFHGGCGCGDWTVKESDLSKKPKLWDGIESRPMKLQK